MILIYLGLNKSLCHGQTLFIEIYYTVNFEVNIRHAVVNKMDVVYDTKENII